MNNTNETHEITMAIKNVLYNDYKRRNRNIKNILRNRRFVTIYDNLSYHYGNYVYTFAKKEIEIKFNYNFTQFVARVILSNPRAFKYYKQYCEQYSEINEANSWNELNKYFLAKKHGIKQNDEKFVKGWAYPEGNTTYIFINNSDTFYYIESFGS